MRKFTVGANFCIENIPLKLGIPALDGYMPNTTAEVVEILDKVDIEDAFSLEWDEGGEALCLAAERGLFAVSPTKKRVSTQGIVTHVTSMAGVCVAAKTISVIKEVCNHILEPGAAFERENRKAIRAGKVGKDVTIIHMEHMPAIYTILSCPEYASNTAKYDGIRYGKRVEGSTMEETYINVRRVGFTTEQKEKIMLGNFLLSKDFYEGYYHNALCMREEIKREFKRAFEQFDVLMLNHPLPAVMVGAPVIVLPGGSGYALMAAWGQDEMLLSVAEAFLEKEGLDV